MVDLRRHARTRSLVRGLGSPVERLYGSLACWGMRRFAEYLQVSLVAYPPGLACAPRGLLNRYVEAFSGDKTTLRVLGSVVASCFASTYERRAASRSIITKLCFTYVPKEIAKRVSIRVITLSSYCFSRRATCVGKWYALESGCAVLQRVFPVSTRDECIDCFRRTHKIF